MSLTLCIQSTYTTVEIGIYKDQTQIAYKHLHKHDASGQLIVVIDQLLRSSDATIDDVTRIIANNGPGPFTTLRVVIATINGISFAKKIPLIGVNALDALTHEVAKPDKINVMMLNAFGNDVYFYLSDGKKMQYGSQNITSLITFLAQTYPNQQILFAGNGAQMHKENITKTIANATINDIPHCSLQSIFTCGQQKTDQKPIYQLTPVYLKDHPAMQRNR